MLPLRADRLSLSVCWRAGANQDWVDVHPAKLGWHSTGHGYGAPIWGPNATIAQLQMFDGFMSATVYRNAFKYIAKTYFTQPNYY
eukprot:COSAG04_NODE_5203_length_1704_cov_1.554517_1_plen_84_part_10